MAKPDASRILWPEFAAACVLIVFRLATCSPGKFWKDWALILGLFGFYYALSGRKVLGQPVLPALMAYLAAVHVLGQLPHALVVWGVNF